MEVPKLNVIRGTTAPQVTRLKGHHPITTATHNSMFMITPVNPEAEAAAAMSLKGSIPHKFYKEISYLDGDGIDDYTLISDEAGIFNGMEGTRVPRTSTTGGFLIPENDPQGVLYTYGTEDEEWLEEADNVI